jgi:hypothetical protein
MTFLDRLALIERPLRRCGADAKHLRQDQQKILAPSRKGWKTASHNFAHDYSQPGAMSTEKVPAEKVPARPAQPTPKFILTTPRGAVKDSAAH